MSLIDRLLGTGSDDDESCCDMQIEEIDDGTDAEATSESTANE